MEISFEKKMGETREKDKKRKKGRKKEEKAKKKTNSQ